jgi:hypothetical protein
MESYSGYRLGHEFVVALETGHQRTLWKDDYRYHPDLLLPCIPVHRAIRM